MDGSLSHLMSWNEGTKGEVPPPLTGPSITISPLPLPHPPTIYVFGGKHVQTRRLTSDMWALDIGTKVWTRIECGDGPGPRYFHSMDTWEDKLVCFGGMSDSDPMSVHGDIWFFDCISKTWSPQIYSEEQDEKLLPSARYAHLSAVSRGQLILSGGQHSDNSWIYEINVYDLKRKIWTSKTQQPEMQGLHSKGAYRSISVSSKQRVIMPQRGAGTKGSSAQSYTINEGGEGGEIWSYSNYDFAKVRRELDIISPNDILSDIPPSPNFSAPPSFNVRDYSRLMRGTSQPPGLRFPTGGIVGNHFILCGLYLASTSAAFSIWSLDMNTMVWRHLEPAVLASGSWNRAIVWPEAAKILVLGNLQNDLSVDYGRRAVNLDHVAVISLEAFGIYTPPKLEIPAEIQEMGLSMLDEKLASDFEVVCDDGRRIKCSRKILSESWAWFAEEEKKLGTIAKGIIDDAPALDIADTLLGSFTPIRLAPTTLTIPEPFPVCVALVQYFYTLSLSTPLQNKAPILSALLFLAKQYKIERLAKLVVHALHERLEPSVAVGVYEISTLAGEQNLQVRALTMVHGAKNATSSRSNRQGPPGAVNTDGQNVTSPTHTIPSSSIAGSSDAGNSTFQGGQDGNYRKARVDSSTIPAEEIEKVSKLLAAFDVDEPPRPESPTERAIPRMTSIPRFTSPRTAPPAPISRPPPLPSTPTKALSRSPSMDSSIYGNSIPRTPSESVKDGFSLPPFLSPQVTPGSTAQTPLETLSEADPMDSTFQKYALQNDYKAPPPALSSQQTQLLNASFIPQLEAIERSSDSSMPSLFSGYRFNAYRQSIQTDSSQSSNNSFKREVNSIMPDTPTSTDFNLNFRPSSLTRSSTISSNALDTMSISSGSTSATGTSKGMLKLEKKMVAQIEKDNKKADQRAKFEALRAEQQRKMALSRAAEQREKEMKAAALPSPTSSKAESAKPQKKLFGKFGQKFSDAVLFPEGGKNSTMF